MKHAGLPWEFGLMEAHRALCENGLRGNVELRTDGGLVSGMDVVKAAVLGAEGFDFGKLLLVAEGCIMARICEKNTCPTGIATHDPKFKAKYKGRPEHVVRVLTTVAEDVQRHLAAIGVRSLGELVGRTDAPERRARAQEIRGGAEARSGFLPLPGARRHGPLLPRHARGAFAAQPAHRGRRPGAPGRRHRGDRPGLSHLDGGPGDACHPLGQLARRVAQSRRSGGGQPVHPLEGKSVR